MDFQDKRTPDIDSHRPEIVSPIPDTLRSLPTLTLTRLNALPGTKRKDTMDVLLISANTETINMPALPIGLGMVAAAAKQAGHNVRFVDLMAEVDPQTALADAILLARPDIIGISIRNVDNQISAAPRFLLDDAKAVVDTCRQLSKSPIVLGGAGYSIFPDTALEYLSADMGIQGEGEAAFMTLLARLEKKEDVSDIPGLYIRSRGCRTPPAFRLNLDDWPFPEPKLFNPQRFQNPGWYLPFQTRRGCPLGCSYCSTAAIEGCRIRRRSVRSVINELSRWKKAGCTRIFFVDNTFNLPPDYAQELCLQLALEVPGISWRAILYPGRTEVSLIKAMARAGCSEVSLGFESGNARVLAGMGKHFKTIEVRRTARMLGDAGIGRTGFLLLGGPDETRESVLESLHFVDSLGLEAVKLTIGIRIYPGTPLAKRARAEGVIGISDDLLLPRFYLSNTLEKWLRETVNRWLAERPHWSM